jgi:hypothetical protein
MIATQSESLIDFFNCKRNISSGLIGRMIPIFINPEAYQITDNYDISSFKERLVMKYVCYSQRNSAIIIEPTKEAKQLAVEYDSMNRALAHTNKFMDSYLNKHAGRACRIAAILKVLDPTPSGNDLNEKYLRDAINISQLLVDHGYFAMNPVGFRCIEAAMKIEEWYRSRNIALFNYSEAKQHLNSLNYKG